MAQFRFRFHQCDGTVTETAEGVDAADLAAARLLAVDQAREIMAGEVRRGRLCLSCWIVVSDARGNNVLTLQFGDAIAFAGRDACDHQTAAEARRSS